MGKVYVMVKLRAALLTLFLGCHQTVLSDLTYKPLDSETLVNETTYFNCSSSITSKKIEWFHYPVGVEAHERKSVYALDKFYKDYEEDFALEKYVSYGAYNLVIRSVKREYAGRYQCQENEGTGNSGFAQLIVLDVEPECSSDINQDGVIGSNACGVHPDELHLSCSTSYHGNIPPALKWVKLGGNEAINENVTMAESPGRLTYNLTIKADVIEDKSSFECQTTKSRTSKHSCTSEIVKLFYIFNASSLSVKNIGEVVNCSANTSSQSCQYNWYNKNDSLIVSNNRILKVEIEGQYVCEATCDLRDEQCTVIAMFINSSISGTGPVDSGSSTTLAVWLILVIILSVIFVLIVFCFFYKRHKRGHKGIFSPCCNRMKAEATLEEEGIFLKAEPNHYASPLLSANSIPGELHHENEMDKPGSTEDNPIFVHETPVHENPEKRKKTEETKKEGMDYDPHPELLHVQSLSSADNEKIVISGLAVLNKELFIAFERKSELKVFQAILFNPLRSVVVKNLNNPLDMVSSPADRCLFISSPKEIYKIDASGRVIAKWPVEDGGSLSVTHDQTVILTDWKASVLIEYSADGEYLCDVSLPVDIHPFHAVKTSDDEFVVSYEHKMMHKVSTFDASGCIIQSFGEMLRFPKNLAVNSDGYIFVADQKNSRVLLMNNSLDSCKVLMSDKDKLVRPLRISLDEANSQMFVADIEADNIRFMVFRLQKHKTDAIEDSAVNQDKPNNGLKEDSGLMEDNAVVVCDDEEDDFQDALGESPKALEASQEPLEASQQAVEESRGEKRKRRD